MNAPLPVRGRMAERVRALLDAYDAYGAELQFLENAAGTTVHVAAAPNLPGWASMNEAAPHLRDLDGADVVDLALGVMLTVCGVRIWRNRGGLDEGGRLVASFPDESLCVRCHSAFGDRAWLIFECNSRDEEAN